MATSSFTVKVVYAVFLIQFFHSSILFADETQDNYLFTLTLEQLMNVKVSSASGIDETLKEAPAAMIVITADDIRKRGYSALWEIFYDLPGFDTVGIGQNIQAATYQRGYRTPWTQRTLFMVNSKVESNLWTHSAMFSNQYGMQNINRIEILYGPASAVYGPNAFLGVVNVITNRPVDITENYAEVNIEFGSFNTRAIDLSAGGLNGIFSFSLGYKNYLSDEAGLDDLAPWGFLTNELYSNSTIWGPVLEHSFKGISYGQYANRSEEEGLLVEVSYKSVTLGYMSYDMENGYGPYYAADHAQSNDGWINTSEQIFLEHSAKINKNFTVDTLASFREVVTGGGGRWTEASPDWNSDLSINTPSFISISNWNTYSTAKLFKQDYQFDYSDSINFSGGIKYEKKSLNKAYEICLYWDESFCAAQNPNETSDNWPTPWGPGVFHSSADFIIIGPPTQDKAPKENVIDITDKGVYFQGIWNIKNWRINSGIRYDKNSLYGSTVNPRVSMVWNIDEKLTAKLMYGEAFQEPAPILLFGGWNGRQQNPDLNPEQMTSVEFIAIYQGENLLHDVSIYKSKFDNVIKEEAENAGTRDIWGIEYRLNFDFINLIKSAENINGYFYYTYTKTESSLHYDFLVNDWVEGDDEIGDIAPHKFNLGINIPISINSNLNLRLNHITERELYSRNPLSNANRLEGERKVDAYTTVDINFLYNFGLVELALKVKNLFNQQYYHPGAELADSGDDFNNRALGYNNSLIPQPGQSWLLSLKWDF